MVNMEGVWKVDTDVPFFNYDAVRVKDIHPVPSSNAASLTAAGDSYTSQLTMV